MALIRFLFLVPLLVVLIEKGVAQTPPLVSVSTIGIQLNGKTVAPAYLRGQVFCLSANDTLHITYTGTDSLTDITYVITRIELWGQVNMGAPILLGQLAATEASVHPDYQFMLRDFNPGTKLPDDDKALRVSVRIGPILKLKGKVLLEMINLNEREDTFSFMLIKKC